MTQDWPVSRQDCSGGGHVTQDWLIKIRLIPVAREMKERPCPCPVSLSRPLRSSSASGPGAAHLQLLELQPEVDEPHNGILLPLRVLRQLQDHLLALLDGLPQLLDVRGQEQTLGRRGRWGGMCQIPPRRPPSQARHILTDGEAQSGPPAPHLCRTGQAPAQGPERSAARAGTSPHCLPPAGPEDLIQDVFQNTTSFLKTTSSFF